MFKPLLAGILALGISGGAAVAQPRFNAPAQPNARILGPAGDASRDDAILAAIARLSQQVSQLSQQLAADEAVTKDVQQKLIAMQVYDNLLLADVQKTRNAVLGVGNLGDLTASLASMKATLGSLQSNVAVLQNGLTAVNSSLSNQSGVLHDLQGREVFTCRAVADIHARVFALPDGSGGTSGISDSASYCGGHFMTPAAMKSIEAKTVPFNW